MKLASIRLLVVNTVVESLLTDVEDCTKLDLVSQWDDANGCNDVYWNEGNERMVRKLFIVVIGI